MTAYQDVEIARLERERNKLLAQNRQLLGALKKLKSYNEDILAGRINYRPEDHIAVAREAIAAVESKEG